MQSIITFEDKVALNENADIPAINKVRDVDINEIKSIVNDSLQGTNAMGSIVVDNVTCKNMFDGLLEDNAIDINTGQNVTASNRRRSVDYIAVQPNTTYTLSYQVEAGLIIFEYQANKTYIGSMTSSFTSSPYTFTTGANTYYIRFSANSSSVTTAQLELGNEATTYTPHNNFGYNLSESMGTIIVDNIKYSNQYDNGTLEIGKTWYGSNNVKRARWYISLEGIDTYSIVINNFVNMDQSAIIEATSLSSSSSGVFITNFENGIAMEHKVTSGAKFLIIALQTTQATMTQALIDAINIKVNIGQKEDEIYSTSEQRIGTWVDGKPLYRKVISINNTGISSSATIATNILNGNEVTKLYGEFIDTSSGVTMPYPTLNSAGTAFLQCLISNNGATIYFRGTDSWGANTTRTHKFTIEYTKTTD